MPDRVKERLVELQKTAGVGFSEFCFAQDCCDKCQYEKYGEDCIRAYESDRLIAHGVTVQEWISVKDRLPSVKKMIDGEEYYKTVAVRIAGSEVETIAYYDQEEHRWFGADDFPILEEVTHWYELPEWNLPQPPKGDG